MLKLKMKIVIKVTVIQIRTKIVLTRLSSLIDKNEIKISDIVCNIYYKKIVYTLCAIKEDQTIVISCIDI